MIGSSSSSSSSIVAYVGKEHTFSILMCFSVTILNRGSQESTLRHGKMEQINLDIHKTNEEKKQRKRSIQKFN